ncbi:MAG: 16S rRNA (guanine(527)-N(7))-methyltransferase RsmG [Bacteroidota bacterium]|nr:16S rRNA (guanine(527)-N(7))-methyltransferase RsmG [Bacteroidota bacterium]
MDILQKYFTDFTSEQTRQFEALKNLYQEWNEKINVISRKDMEEFYLHHVLHSLSLAAVFDFRPGSRVLDLGTGGGFPGVPLAIFFPKVHFHLVDSIAKKLKVVEEVAAATGIRNITVSHARVESLRDPSYEVVVSRAVAPLKDLWKWSKPLLKKKIPAGDLIASGLICLKGGDLAEEISQSGTRPRVFEIEKIFEEPYFREKFIVQVLPS